MVTIFLWLIFHLSEISEFYGVVRGIFWFEVSKICEHAHLAKTEGLTYIMLILIPTRFPQNLLRAVDL